MYINYFISKFLKLFYITKYYCLYNFFIQFIAIKRNMNISVFLFCYLIIDYCVMFDATSSISNKFSKTIFIIRTVFGITILK